MCLAFIPPGRRPLQPRSGKRTSNQKRTEKHPPRVRTKAIKKGSKQKAKNQATLREYFGTALLDRILKNEAIEATGDPLIEKGAGIIRFAFQNINGISLRAGSEHLLEAAAIGALQLDVTGFSETNIHWNAENRERIKRQLELHLGPTKVACASNAPNKHDDGYQPGGTMLAATGDQGGRVEDSGNDPWGRFSWMTMKGRRDEGILVITAYRVSQKKGTTAGPSTAYTQQLNQLLKAGVADLDPRQRILDDLRKLITSKRADGFRPILMMDANDDWMDRGGKAFRSFMEELHLVDPLYNKFHQAGLAETTYARGARRIDYILVDSMIEPAIKRIGTLGLHEGIESDHVMLYMDLDEEEAFKGIINRPVMHPCRDFKIEHADKAEKFIKRFRELAEESKFCERVETLRKRFEKYGPTDECIKAFHDLDTEIIRCLLSASKSVTRAKFGYQRSPFLTEAGMRLHFWKAVLSAKRRKAKYQSITKFQAEKLEIDLDEADQLSRREVRKKINDARRMLWEIQRVATQKRVEWLEKNAQDIARAAGEPDWKKKMNEMARLARERGVNRKITRATKGPHKPLDSIEVPKYEWFYSPGERELYHYDKGVFEAYSARRPTVHLIPTDPTRFHKHHHLKVLPADAVPATVEEEDDAFVLVEKSDPCEIWEEITTPKEIERIILERNKRHLQQSDIEPGRIHDPIMQRMMENNGNSDLIQDIVDGKLNIDEATDEAIQAWIHALQMTAQRVKELDSLQAVHIPRITGAMSREDFQGGFKVVDENTTSSPSNVNYSIWKTVAKEDDLAEWLAVMMSLPFMYGFVNQRWARCIDTMLEKKAGNRKIHMLRIIGILEADFNTALKILYGRKLMQLAEKTGIHSDQWGSRNNRTSTDPALMYMMTFEYGRYMKFTISAFDADQGSCFDRMQPDLDNSVAIVHGMAPEVGECRSKTLDAMEHHCKTANGVSRKTYKNQAGEPKKGGEVQGKSDNPSLWCLTSDKLLVAMDKMYPRMSLPSASGREPITNTHFAFVDDVRTLSGTEEWGQLASQDTMVKLHCGAQKFSDVMDVTAAYTAFHKCQTSILGWKQHKGSLIVDYNVRYEMTLRDSQNAATVIKQISPNLGPRALGFCQALDGNTKPEYRFRVDKIKKMCKAATSIYLTQSEAWTMLNERLIAQTIYGMRLSQFTFKECHDLDVIAMGTFLPLLKVNRSTARALVHGPLQYGGMDIDKHSSLQAQWGISYFMQCIRWDKETAKSILDALDAFQLASGFITPVLETPGIPIDYLSKGWIPHLRRELKRIDGELHVEKAWRPRLQRVNDESIMEPIAADQDIPLRDKILANEFRIWMGVTTIAELANEAGTAIEWHRLSGHWRARQEVTETGRTLRFPNQPEPTDEHLRAMRRCLRKCFCTGMRPRQRKDYKLDEPLGQWFLRPRNIAFQCYVYQRKLFWRDEYGVYPCSPTGSTTIWKIEYDQTAPLPERCHPITFRLLEDDPGKIWVWRSYNPYRFPTTTPTRTVDSTFVERPGAPVTIVSDASVHIKANATAGAWRLFHHHDEVRAVSQRLEHQPQAHSFRHEMETAYLALQDADNILEHRHNITSCMDCESGLTVFEQPITRPKQTMGTDMDIVLAWKALEERTDHDVTLKWVEGHADDPKKNKKPSEITKLQWENIYCDEAAEAEVQRGHAPPPFTPLPGYRAMLKIKGSWVTTNHRANIKYADTAPDMIVYARERLSVSEQTFETINWQSVGRVMKSFKIHRRIRTSKMMYRLLPVGHNWRRCRLSTDRCPCCGEPDETFEHLMQCPNKELEIVRTAAICELRREGTALKVPARAMDAIVAIVFAVFNGTEDIERTHSEAINQAVDSQRAIGFYHMTVGFISLQWVDTLEALGVTHPQTMMEQIHALLLDGVCERIWEVRNSIKHDKEKNAASFEEERSLSDKLCWFLRNHHEALDYRHRFLVDYTADDIQRWKLTTKRAKVSLLENAARFYENLTEQHAAQQSTIDDWLDSFIKLRNGRLIPRRPDQHAKPRQAHTQADSVTSDSTEEFEFDG